MSDLKKDIENSKRVIKEVTEHKEMFGIPDRLWFSTLAEYREVVSKGAFFWVDHHECLRHEFSGEILAANQEQVNILIEQLKELRKDMLPMLDCTKEDN
ncbi:Uncharacterised protein [Yersinia pseudotuberculosis]|uniref:hypothetical protein n=1 Tax=Yersinia pseudotuberculosis TaxID=633 RepID=UPI000E05D62D|nr:hypothetical protein [Yersinia pseudotuberculosis]SUP87870.1 Uncharacterised protein [Yersinia pseudotuberculosis]